MSRIGPGPLVAVVGGSGAGKDTLLAGAREALGEEMVLVRRTITRPRGPGEDHDPVSEQEFRRLAAAGAFCAHWSAHGLLYGLPVSLEEEARADRTVVVNASRTAVPDLVARSERPWVIRVSVSPEVRAARLRERGREDEADISARLARADPAPTVRADLEIVNDRSIDAGVSALVAGIRAARVSSSPQRLGSGVRR